MLHIKSPPSKAELLYDPTVRDAFNVGNSIQMIRRRNPLMKVGWTNGAFRVLTPAHCVFLSLCRSKCDLLIVGVNSDMSLRLLKRESPFSTRERAFALASLTVVDYVIPFDEETPLLAISKIDPSMVFKGPDYTPDKVVSGGRTIEIIDHPFDIHTSDILRTKEKTKYFKI